MVRIEHQVDPETGMPIIVIVMEEDDLDETD